MLSSATNSFTQNSPDQEKSLFDIDPALALCLKIDFKSWK